jgi:hypothetical protein
MPDARSSEDILKEYLNRADGFVFVGINDYPPDRYREPKRTKTVVTVFIARLA